MKRDQKNIYSSNQKNIVGLTSPYEEPKNPDIVLINNGSSPPNEVTDKLELMIKKAGFLI